MDTSPSVMAHPDHGTEDDQRGRVHEVVNDLGRFIDFVQSQIVATVMFHLIPVARSMPKSRAEKKSPLPPLRGRGSYRSRVDTLKRNPRPP